MTYTALYDQRSAHAMQMLVLPKDRKDDTRSGLCTVLHPSYGNDEKNTTDTSTEEIFPKFALSSNGETPCILAICPSPVGRDHADSLSVSL